MSDSEKNIADDLVDIPDELLKDIAGGATSTQANGFPATC